MTFPAASTGSFKKSPSCIGDVVVPQIDAVLDQVLGPSSLGPWALLDCPVHSNVGDSAIWLGTLKLLEARFGRPPGYVTPNAAFPAHLDLVAPEGPVLLLGGGNFGDLWEGYWENRVAIFDRFRHRRIVQMPQSIHFRDPGGDALRETRAAIARHPNFSLLVRDLESMEFARKQFDCDVRLCPDMAFGLRHLAAEAPPGHRVLALMREDQERRDDGAGAILLRDHAVVADWIDADPHPVADRVAPRLVRALPRLNRPLAVALERAFRRQAQRHLLRGVALLGRGEVVVTDRLHGHILCCLMGKRHVVLDNSYGKISRYIESWPDDGLTLCAGSVQEALEQLRSLD